MTARCADEAFGSPAFPARLWVYTNFHCNLACSYCAVASSPRAAPRLLAPAAVERLVGEALAEGFDEVYLTGGEPFAHREIGAIVEGCAERVDTVVMTNAMLFSGRRRALLERLARLPRLVLQTSLDSATPAGHDRWRGAGSWSRALAGIEYARRLGLPVRVAMTDTGAAPGEADALRARLARLGIAGADVAVRPLVKRGFAADLGEGEAVCDQVVAPELTFTADGWHWHAVGGDLGSSPDMLVAPPEAPIAEAKRRVEARLRELRAAGAGRHAKLGCAV